ncbi:MAG: hypothetical protein ACREBN_01785, partial [Burkholderiaceae bacterium]
LKAWIERMLAPPEASGEFQTEDRVPATLTPALRSIFDEMTPYLAECARVVRSTPAFPEGSGKAVRFNGEVSYPLAGGIYRQTGITYPVWMAQRMLEAFRQMPEPDQLVVREWLDSVGGSGVLELDLPRVKRIGLAAARVA